MLHFTASILVASPLLAAAPKPSPAELAVKKYEGLCLEWVAALGTANEKAAYKRQTTQRSKVVDHGDRATSHLLGLAQHEQVNVRRGAAITLSMIVEEHEVTDAKLLDAVLIRMIRDDDIKVRSNFYHVVKQIISNREKHKPAGAR